MTKLIRKNRKQHSQKKRERKIKRPKSPRERKIKRPKSPKKIIFIHGIEEKAKKNTHFRKTLFAGYDMQMGLLCLKPGEIIDFEIHKNADQYIHVIEGEAKLMEKEWQSFKNGNFKKEADCCVIACMTEHLVKNMSSTKELKCINIYSEPIHKKNFLNQKIQKLEK